MLFDEIRAAAASGDALEVPATWAQGRTVYGGLSAGLLSDAAAQGIDDGRRLRSLKVSFLRPLEAEKTFEIDREELSSGRTVAVCSTQIRQDDVIRVTAQANFVADRESKVAIETFQAPALKPFDAPETFAMRARGFPLLPSSSIFTWRQRGCRLRDTIYRSWAAGCVFTTHRKR